MVLIGILGGHSVFRYLSALPLPVWSSKPAARGPAGLQEIVRPAYARSTGRRVYAFSVIPGGAYSRDELIQELVADPVAAHHFDGFDVAQAQLVSANGETVYVSYRRGANIFWSHRPIRLIRGEGLLTDGTNLARARCGNRVSTRRLGPTEFREPPDIAQEEDPDSLDALSVPSGVVLPRPPDPDSNAALATDIFPPAMVEVPASKGGAAPAVAPASGPAGVSTSSNGRPFPGTYLWFPLGGGGALMPFPIYDTATGFNYGPFPVPNWEVLPTDFSLPTWPLLTISPPAPEPPSAVYVAVWSWPWMPILPVDTVNLQLPPTMPVTPAGNWNFGPPPGGSSLLPAQSPSGCCAQAPPDLPIDTWSTPGTPGTSGDGDVPSSTGQSSAGAGPVPEPALTVALAALFVLWYAGRVSPGARGPRRPLPPAAHR